MMSISQLPRERWPASYRIACAGALAVMTAAAWWAWLGLHDLENGDYQLWQAIGCVVSVLIIGIVSPLFVVPWLAVPIMTLAFAGAVAADWLPSDETGQAGVGVIMVTFGMAVASSVVVPVANTIWRKAQYQ